MLVLRLVAKEDQKLFVYGYQLPATGYCYYWAWHGNLDRDRDVDFDSGNGGEGDGHGIQSAQSAQFKFN